MHGAPSESSSRTTRSCGGSHNDGSSLGKRTGVKTMMARKMPVAPELFSSRERSVNSSVTDYIRAWQDGVTHVRGDAGR